MAGSEKRQIGHNITVKGQAGHSILLPLPRGNSDFVFSLFLGKMLFLWFVFLINHDKVTQGIYNSTAVSCAYQETQIPNVGKSAQVLCGPLQWLWYLISNLHSILFLLVNYIHSNYKVAASFSEVTGLSTGKPAGKNWTID